MEWGPLGQWYDNNITTADTTKTNSLVVQGKFVEIKDRPGKGFPPPPGCRKPITKFSSKARLRLLRLIAKIDWSRLPHGMFVTLTYPDECIPKTVRHATIQRTHFTRKAEAKLCEKIPILWRKELIDRKSGKYLGKSVAHWHLTLFTDKWIDVADINAWWRDEIGWKWEIQCHARKLESGEHAAFYLAKYLSKKVQESVLDYQTKLTKVGRAYGITRRNLIPMSECLTMDNIPEDQWAEIMCEVYEIWKDPLGNAMPTFTLIGPSAERMKAAIMEILS